VYGGKVEKNCGKMSQTRDQGNTATGRQVGEKKGRVGQVQTKNVQAGGRNNVQSAKQKLIKSIWAKNGGKKGGEKRTKGKKWRGHTGVTG